MCGCGFLLVFVDLCWFLLVFDGLGWVFDGSVRFFDGF